MAHEKRDRAWWLAAGLLVTAFLARGPLYLSVFPPFEGWDEYQHLGYIAHLDRTGRMPVFHQDTRVPAAIRPLVRSVPHSQWGGEQVKEWGAVSYAEYWNAPPPVSTEPPASSPRLYQAQHPPLAYVLALPVWRALNPSRQLEALYLIRGLNVIVVAAALALFAAALRRLVPAFWPRVAVFALVCLHPLFFQNAARVANDAVALAAGLAGISILVLADGRTLLTRGLLAAVCIAAGIWSKQTGLTLVPALVLGLPLIGWAHGVAAPRLWRVTGLVAVALLLLVAPLWVWSYQQYGSIVTTQESLDLAARSDAMAALVTAVLNLPWVALVDTLFVPGRPWVGGWSFLPMQETLRVVYSWYWSALLVIAAVGAIVAMRGRKTVSGSSSSSLDTDHAHLAVCALAVVFTALGLVHHAVVSHAVFGQPMTNPWYFMTALPFVFVLLVRGLVSMNRRLAIGATAALAVLFVAIDLHGTWVQMPAGYAGTPDVTLQWARLSAIHPGFLSGDLRWTFLAMQLGALALVIGGLTYVSRRRPPGAAAAVVHERLHSPLA